MLKLTTNKEIVKMLELIIEKLDQVQNEEEHEELRRHIIGMINEIEEDEEHASWLVSQI